MYIWFFLFFIFSLLYSIDRFVLGEAGLILDGFNDLSFSKCHAALLDEIVLNHMSFMN